MRESIKTDVSLASHTHQTPHVVLPQMDPVTNVIRLKSNPISIFFRLSILNIGDFVIRYITAKTADIKYRKTVFHADVTCIYIMR